MPAVESARDLLSQRSDAVAPFLLGSRLTSAVDGKRVTARLVEVEAYAGPGDPASHAYRGMTQRNRSMFGKPGLAYVYFTYGMHWCLNVVVGGEGQPFGVLLRSAVVEDGRRVARARRTSAHGRVPADHHLARGPANLAQALGVTGVFDGVDLLVPDSILTLDLARPPARAIRSGPRVGVRRATQRPWRFWLPDEPAVSAYRAASVRGRTHGGSGAETSP